MSACEVLTHGGPDRRGKVCQCASCGLLATCTPRQDFYTRHGDPLGPLFCDQCIVAESFWPTHTPVGTRPN